ncbi:MAG TPA: 3-dehydroquinate synthase [Pyrinomonadaceae bacterium]|nr:3-dehydroquinate synthase [Pyrinomonadaceae bacterium]
MSRTVSINITPEPHAYDIYIDDGGLSSVGEWAKAATGGSVAKIAIISNKKVFGLYGALVESSLTSAGFAVSMFLIGDGERYKNLQTFEKVTGFLGANGFTRTDAVLALGGGVVGDIAGFAASVHMRGIKLLQIPTTLLAMIDSSVGGKTAVNTANGKNLVGAFYQPSGVLIDTQVLRTLPRREITAGLCEAVKQAVLSGGETFSLLREFLEMFQPGRLKAQFTNPEFVLRLNDIIASQAAFKATIVAADEREDLARSDGSSRKILNLGHTLAHALEKATAYRYFKHGEAVGWGLMFAAEVSKKLELLDENTVILLNDVVHRAGKLPAIAHLDPVKVFDSFRYDKKVVRESLQWVLLRGIGKPVIIPQTQIPVSVLVSSFQQLASR